MVLRPTRRTWLRRIVVDIEQGESCIECFQEMAAHLFSKNDDEIVHLWVLSTALTQLGLVVRVQAGVG